MHHFPFHYHHVAILRCRCCCCYCRYCCWLSVFVASLLSLSMTIFKSNHCKNRCYEEIVQWAMLMAREIKCFCLSLEIDNKTPIQIIFYWLVSRKIEPFKNFHFDIQLIFYLLLCFVVTFFSYFGNTFHQLNLDCIQSNVQICYKVCAIEMYSNFSRLAP